MAHEGGGAAGSGGGVAGAGLAEISAGGVRGEAEESGPVAAAQACLGVTVLGSVPALLTEADAQTMGASPWTIFDQGEQDGGHQLFASVASQAGRGRPVARGGGPDEGPEGAPLRRGSLPWMLLRGQAGPRSVVGGPGMDGDAVCVWCGSPVHPSARTCSDYHRGRLSRVRREVRAFADGDRRAWRWLREVPARLLEELGRALACAAVEQGRRVSVAGVLLLVVGDARGLVCVVEADGTEAVLAALGAGGQG